GIRRGLAERLLERPPDDLRTCALVALQVLELERVARVQERDAAAGDDALLEGGPGGLQRVLDAVLLLLHLGLGRGADLDDRDAAGELRQPFLQLLAVEVGVGVLDLGLQLLDPALDRIRRAGPVDDRGRVLVDDHGGGLAELFYLRVFALEAHLLADTLGARQVPNVFRSAFGAVPEPRRLIGAGG